MSVIDKLLRVDPKKAAAQQERTYKSKQLARLIGSKEPVEVRVKELTPERLSDLMGMMTDSQGNVAVSKAFDGNAMICTDAVVDPDLKDPDLLEHFGCATPLDLAKKLFKFEVSDIAGEVLEMAGLSSDTEDEVKNS